MDVFDDEYPITSDQVTCAQINQLKNAWQLSNVELLKYKALVQDLTTKNEYLLKTLNHSNVDLELETTKSLLSSICSNYPNEPVTLIKELTKLLPIINHHQFVVTAIIKTGESWVGISSNAVCNETINFKSRLLDEMLKFRLKSKSKVTIESLSSILPLPVVNYIYCGTVPTRESFHELFNDDSQCPVVSLPYDDVHLRQNLSTNVTVESLFKQAIVIRSNHDMVHDMDNKGITENDREVSDRVVWVLSFAHKSSTDTDLHMDHMSFQKIAVDVFGADTCIFRGDNGYFMSEFENNENIDAHMSLDTPTNHRKTVSEVSVTTITSSNMYWQFVFKFSQQLVLTTLLHNFESKKSEINVLQSAALLFFNNLLRDHSYHSEFLKDAYSDEIWQHIPLELEDFINTQIINTQYSSNKDGDNFINDSDLHPKNMINIENVNKTCHCDIFVTSSFGLSEMNTGISEIPLIDSKRCIHTLYMNSKHDSILNDGHSAALNSVLYNALVTDTISIQSYSEISFHERNQHLSNSSSEHKNYSTANKRTMSGIEQSPQVHFHTLIAVPLLMSAGTNHQYDDSEELKLSHRHQEVKGCILINISSSIVSSSNNISNHTVNSGRNTLSGFMKKQSHPVYTPTVVTNSTVMDQISSNYYLLEAGNQSMIEKVVGVTNAVGNLIIKFLINANCHPISLFPIKTFLSHIQKRFDSTSENSLNRDLDLIANGLYSILTSQTTPEHESFKSIIPKSNISFHKNKQVNTNTGVDTTPGIHLSLVTHLKQMFHSDWVLICTLASSTSLNVIHLIDNAGVDCYINESDLPPNWRSFIIPSLQKKIQSKHQAHHIPQGHEIGKHGQLLSVASLTELPKLNELDISEILTLLHFEHQHKHSLHTICDSSSSKNMHHSYGICLSSSDLMQSFYSEYMPQEHYQSKKNIVVITGRFFRGPFDNSLHALDELRSSFQTAVSHRDLLLSQKALMYLTSQNHFIQQEVLYTNQLEENLKQLHQNTLGSTKSSMSSLISFRKGLLKVLLDFFSSLHRLHFASPNSLYDLQVLGIELIVYESTGLEEGRRRSWCLDPHTADWIKVHTASKTNNYSANTTSNKNTSPNRQAAYHTVVDILHSVYEEKGSSVLYVHKKQNHYKENKLFSKFEDESEGIDGEFDTLKVDEDLIGMHAAIHIHYETPKSQVPNSSFFSSLQSSPTSMRILKGFMGVNAQALFQPIYTVYSPIKQYLGEHPSMDEGQQWEDNALHAQASNIAINSLTRAILQNSLKQEEAINDDSSKNLLHKQPHYRYLYQKQLLRQLMEVPPFSAFMLMPIREVTFAEMSLLRGDLSSDSDSSEGGGESYGRAEENVRYVHLLPSSSSSSIGNSSHVHQDNKNTSTHKKKSHSNVRSLLTSMLPAKLNKNIQTAVKDARAEQDSSKQKVKHYTERASRLIVLEGGTGDILHTYLGQIHDKQQRKRQNHNALSGSEQHIPDEYDLYGYVDISAVRSSGTNNAFDKNSKHNEVTLVNPRSLVLLYSPLSSNHRHNANESKAEGSEVFLDDYGVLQSDNNSSLDHYYLIVCRNDRMIVPSALARLQSCLDEIFMPWRVLAASQPWFECMTGIEQLVRASSNNLPTQVITKVENSLNLSFSSPVINVFEQGQNILNETIASMRRILGSRCIGAVGYQIDQNTDSTVSDNMVVDLLRCCSDNGIVTCAKTGRIGNMLQGPAKLHSLSTIDLLYARYNEHQYTNKLITAPMKRHESNESKHSLYTAYYVEMSSGEHIRQLDKEFTWSKKKSHKHHSETTSEIASNVQIVQDILSACHVFLRSDIRVLQIYFTAAGSNNNQQVDNESSAAVENKSIVASILLYISMASQDDAIDIEAISADAVDNNHPIYPSICHIYREDFVKNAVHRIFPSQNYFLTLGMLNCIMRVGDTAGLLLASLYRQQYDCYQNALQSYNHRKLMHLHAHKLGETLARINHEVKVAMNITIGDEGPMHENNTVAVDNRSLASSPSRASKHSHHSNNNSIHGHMQKNEQYLSDAHEQKEFAELALESAQFLIQQYQQLKESYTKEQQTLSNVRMKYQELSEDNRMKAARFRAYFEAVQVAVSIINTRSVDEDDSLNSLNSGMEKVAEVQASIPDVISLHTSIASIVSTTQTLRKCLETIAELAAHEEFSSRYFNNLLRSFSERCSSFEVNKDDQSLLSLDSHDIQDVEPCNNYRNTLTILRNTPYELEASATDMQHVKTLEKMKFKDGYGGYERDFHDAPDASASIWWVVEPGSHLNVINLASSNTSKESCLDSNTLYSKDKFIEALNSKQAVIIEGEELLQVLPHIIAFYSSRGYGGYGNNNFCNIQLIYQPILASLYYSDNSNNPAKEPAEYSYYSSEESSKEEGDNYSEKMVVAIIQYIVVRDTRINNDNAGECIDSLDGSQMMQQDIINSNVDQFSAPKLAAALRQSLITQMEQIMAYIGQHIVLRSKIIEGTVGPVTVTPSLSSSRRSKSGSEPMSLLQSFKHKISIDDHLMGGTPFVALVSALDYILNPNVLCLTNTLVEQAKEHETMKVVDHWKGYNKKSGGSIASESRSSRSRNSHQSHSSEQSRRSQSAERAVSTTSLHPISAWVGQLLAGLLRADAASMLHLSHSQRSKSDSNISAVYEGIRFRYNHGAISCLESHDNHPPSPQLLRMRPSSCSPLQSLLDKYEQHLKNLPLTKSTDTFMIYQESILNNKKKSIDIVYSSKSVASVASAADEINSSNIKMKYILTAGISTQPIQEGVSSSAMKGSSSSKTSHVSFSSKSNSSGSVHSKESHQDQKELNELLIVELSHRPTTSDLKAFSSVTQLVQLYIWSQHQKEHLKHKEIELNTISSSLADTSQLLVEQKDQNRLNSELTRVMEDFKRYVLANQIDGYRALCGLEIEDIMFRLENDQLIYKVEHIINAMKSSQDHLCHAIGKSQQIHLVSLPRVVMKELRDMLNKAETLSTRSKGSMWEEDSGLTGRLDLGLHIEPISKHFPKRFLQTLLSDQPKEMKFGLGQHSAASLYMMKHHPQLAQLASNSETKESPLKVATRLFGALCIHLNMALICDIFDCIDVNSLDTSINNIPELARSIMIPVLDHSVDQSCFGLFDDPNHIRDVNQYNNEHLMDTHLKSILLNITNRTTNTDPITQQSDAIKVVTLSDMHMNSNNSDRKNDKDVSKLLNNAHAWFIQLVFPSIEARDEYATVIINGDRKNNSANNISASISSPASDLVKNNSNKETVHNLLQYSFLNNFTYFVKQNIQQSRISTKNALSFLQIHLDEAIQSRISACMDQILLMSIPNNIHTTLGVHNNNNEVLLDDDINSLHSLEFRIDQIAASFAHVSNYISLNQVPNKLSYIKSLHPNSNAHRSMYHHHDDNDSDNDLLIIDQSEEGSPISFEVSISDTRLHWMNINTSVGTSTILTGNEYVERNEERSNRNYAVGDWLTVELATMKPLDIPTAASSPEYHNAAIGSVYDKNHISNDAKNIDLSKQLDSLLYQRCKYKQWEVIPSPLSKNQVNDLLSNTNSINADTSTGVSISLLDSNQFPNNSNKRNVRTNSNDGEVQYTSIKLSAEKSKQINSFVRSDGSIELQLLIVVKGSEQPAIIELRLVCLLTSTKNAIIACRRNGTSKSKALIQDELALAEMIEQVFGMILKPTIPTFKLVRSSIAHLLEHCVAARACVRWEYEWDAYLLHAQQRISLLCSALTLLTSEGYKAVHLLKLIQEIFCRIPSLYASHIICKDHTNNHIIYDHTMSYTNEKTNTNSSSPKEGNDEVLLSTPASSKTTLGHSAVVVAAASATSLQSSEAPAVNKSLLLSTASTPSHSKMVSFINLCTTTPENKPPTEKPHPSDRTEGSRTLHTTTNTTTGLYEDLSKNRMNDIEQIDFKLLEDLDQFEIIFDCYEVHGKVTIYFKYPTTYTSKGSSSSNSNHINSNNDDSIVNDITNPNPYHPISSPSKMRRNMQNIHNSTTKKSKKSNDKTRNNNLDSEKIDQNDDEEDISNINDNKLISLKALFENITRALARRVFELYRGGKNKKLLANKQHELLQKSNQLMHQEEILQNLEISNTMSRQELQNAASESERLRLLMAAEQRNLKESIKQKKEMNSHLRQSLLEFRRESDTQSLIYKKQTQALKEKVLGLEMMNERSRKDLDKLRTKEIIIETSSNTLNQQIKELQSMLKTAETTIKQLRIDLQTSNKDLSILQTKEQTKLLSDDVKMSGLLNKINKIDQDLQYARGTNEKLIKQLDACKLTMKQNQEESQKQINLLQNKINNYNNISNNNSNSNSPTRVNLNRNYDIISNQEKLITYDEIKQKLLREEQHTMELQKQINDMESERRALVDGWQDIKSKTAF